MPQESNTAASSLASAVAACRGDDDALHSLKLVYARADAACAERHMTCRACGKCCRFAEVGHRLLVSPLELALLMQVPPDPPAVKAGVCSYQKDGLCTARQRRPLGCRVFFCDAPADDCSRLYESCHRQICRLHDRRGLPYLYVELTAALMELTTAGTAGQNADFPIDTPKR